MSLARIFDYRVVRVTQEEERGVRPSLNLYKGASLTFAQGGSQRARRDRPGG